MLTKQSGDGEIGVRRLTIGIDAANLRGGGGVTHLIELLRAAQPDVHGFDRIVIWGGSRTLHQLDDHPWLVKRFPIELDRGLLHRTLWQRYRLSEEVRDAGCDVLFVPGGSYAGDFYPVVNMSRNMLPFEWKELKRYGWSPFALKLLFLRLTQSRSYKKTDGLIFLTEYARQGVSKVTGELQCKACTIAHGLNPCFNQAPKLQHAITDYSEANPYRVLYVSTIDLYKHQWNVVEAIATLRQEGFPVVLDLVGSAYPPALRRLNEVIARLDGYGSWVRYLGAMPFKNLPHHYVKADLGLFASSCENMPNILLETMASGLPIACSNRGPMPEVLGAAGVYFDPEKSADIASALRILISSPNLRSELAQLSYQKAQQYSWRRCAAETFQFLKLIANG